MNAEQPDLRDFHGVVVPVATPFGFDGEVDQSGLHNVVEYLLAGGAHGLLLLGTTGEAASVSSDQRIRLIESAIAHTDGRASVYAGIVNNCLSDSITEAKAYLAAGATAVVAPLPSYYPLSDDLMLSYFTRLADDVHERVLLYNIPPTTKMSIPLDVVAELSDDLMLSYFTRLADDVHERVLLYNIPPTTKMIVGIKDSENDGNRLSNLLKRLGGREDFKIFVGATVLTVLGLKAGAVGYVPSVGNIAAKFCRELYNHAMAGNWEEAEKLQDTLCTWTDIYQGSRTLAKALPRLKAAMALLGLCKPAVLPPLRPISDGDREGLKAQLRKHGLSRSVFA